MEEWFNNYMKTGEIQYFPMKYTTGDIDFLIHKINEQSNNANLLNLHGYLCHYGKSEEQNYSKAIELYQRAIHYGSSDAMVRVGYMYAYGKGVEMNKQKTLEFYQKAIDLGNSNAMRFLARMYEDGNGVEVNDKKAIELYQHAIEKGNDMAMNNLLELFTDEGRELLKEYILEHISLQREKKHIKDLEEYITELEYQPGGVGYHEAKEEFEELAQQ